MHYDVAVVGLGGMGSAILANCAARGARVMGFEQFERGHSFGSSSGKSRMIRKAYFEDAAYVPLLLRAYELWRELERASGSRLLQLTGALLVGPERSPVIHGCQRAARAHGLPIEVLSQSEVLARYPTLGMREDEVAVFEPDAGVLRPEAAIEAQLQLAARAGTEMGFRVGMKSWMETSDGFEVSLSDESRITARSLVLTAGAWLQPILESLGVTIRVQRNVQAWFAPRSDTYAVGRFPAFLLDRAELAAPFYGFPDFGEGIKVAFHGFGELTAADDLERRIDQARDVTPLENILNEWMPGAADSWLGATACMYTLTPDEHFVVDRHPAHPNVILCGGFSGHGFKFASVIGEIGAELALEGGTRHAIDFLSLRRFMPRA